jgi:hypothetical protein
MVPVDNGLAAWHWDLPKPLNIIATDKNSQQGASAA